MTKPASPHQTPPPSAMHRFRLQVHSERGGHPWTASLEADHAERLIFTSPLELARFLANLNAESRDESHSDTAAPIGLR
jgi:hypothetical protein